MTLWSCSSRNGSSEIMVCFMPVVLSVHRFTVDAARCRSASSTSSCGRVRALMAAISSLRRRSKSHAECCAAASNSSAAASTSSRSSSDSPFVRRASTSTCSADTSPSARASSNPGTVVHARSRSSAAFASRAEPLPPSNVSNPPPDSPTAFNSLARREIRMSTYAVYAFSVAFNAVIDVRSSRSGGVDRRRDEAGDGIEDSLLVHRTPPSARRFSGQHRSWSERQNEHQFDRSSSRRSAPGGPDSRSR